MIVFSLKTLTLIFYVMTWTICVLILIFTTNKSLRLYFSLKFISKKTTKHIQK